MRFVFWHPWKAAFGLLSWVERSVSRFTTTTCILAAVFQLSVGQHCELVTGGGQ